MSIRRPIASALYFILMTSVHGAQAENGATPTGKQLYQAYCSQCHGLEGDGFGVNSYDLDVAPRDHTDTEEMSARTDQELFKAIQLGGKSVNKSVLMPAWGGNLDDDEIHSIVSHLRDICCTETEE